MRLKNIWEYSQNSFQYSLSIPFDPVEPQFFPMARILFTFSFCLAAPSRHSDWAPSCVLTLRLTASLNNAYSLWPASYQLLGPFYHSPKTTLWIVHQGNYQNQIQEEKKKQSWKGPKKLLIQISYPMQDSLWQYPWSVVIWHLCSYIHWNQDNVF